MNFLSLRHMNFRLKIDELFLSRVKMLCDSVWFFPRMKIQGLCSVIDTIGSYCLTSNSMLRYIDSLTILRDSSSMLGQNRCDG